MKSSIYDKSLMARAMSMPLEPPRLERQKRMSPTSLESVSLSSNLNKENLEPNICRDIWSCETQAPCWGSNGYLHRQDPEELTLNQLEDLSTITSDIAQKTTHEVFGAHLDTAISQMAADLLEPTGSPPTWAEIDRRLSELDADQAAAQTLLELQKICCLELPPEKWRAPTQRRLYSIPVESALSPPRALNGATPAKPQLFIGCMVPPDVGNRVGVTTRAQARIGKPQTTSGGMDTMA